MKKYLMLDKYSIIAILIALMSSALLIASAKFYSHTVDEPVHIAAGLEFWDKKTYTLELQHPPVARASFGLIPYLQGFSYVENKNIWEAGKINLYQSDYRTLVDYSRLGNLPFFLLLSLVVFLWARDLVGGGGAALAVLLSASLPIILAHAGLSTLDMAAASTMLLSLYCFYQCLQLPSVGRLLVFSFANAIAICTKFSAIPFLLLSYLAFLSLSLLLKEGSAKKFLSSLTVKNIFLILLVFVVSCWACYGFDVISLSESIPDFDRKLNKALSKYGALEDYSSYIMLVANAKLPAVLVSIPAGILQVAFHNSSGHESYLLGEVREHGWWYFFFVGFFFKTPVLFLLISIASILLWFKSLYNSGLSVRDVLPVSVVAIFVFVAVFSNINIGMRHILLVFPLLAIWVVAVFMPKLARYSKVFRCSLVSLVVILSLVPVAINYGSYLSYFNAFSGERPEHILVKSDFWWGQDLEHLKNFTHERNIESAIVAMRGLDATLLTEHGLSSYKNIENVKFVSGWAFFDKSWLAINGINLNSCLTGGEDVGRTILAYKIDVPFDYLKCK